MSSIDKASAYKDSVQPGIPRLGDTPKGWTRAPMSKHLYEERRPVDLKDDVAYDLVTVKRSRGGVVKRDTKLGRDISVKTQFRVNAGDFLISKRQIVHGACGIVPPELDGSTVSNEYAVLRSHGSIDLEYLKYLAHSVYFQQTCFHSSIGVHIEKMIFKTEKWLSWEFDLPPISEQRRIVELLSTWDSAIATSKQLMANSETQSRALSLRLVNAQVRLQKFQGDWKRVRLGDIANIYQPKTIGQADLTDHGYPVWGANGIIGWYSSYNHETWQPIITCRGSTCGVVNRTSGKSWITGNAMVVNADENRGLDKLFLYFLLVSIDYRTLICGSGQPQITRGPLSALTVVLPPSLAEQRAIAKVLDDADKIVESGKETLARLLLEKSALMQQLFTGQRRVSNMKVAA